MKIPKTFERDLFDTYHGHMDLNQLIRKQEPFLRGLARFALRYRTSFMISDEDDLFQEACWWLLDSIWEFDENKSSSNNIQHALSRYVIYHIGVRLAGIVKFEKNIKRHPDPNHSWRVDVWGSAGKDEEGNTIESCLPSNVDIEVQTAIRQAFTLAHDNISDIAKELMIALIDCDGNFAEAVRMISSRKHIVKKYGNDEAHLKYRMRFKVLPEISQFFQIGDIIP